MRRLQPSVVRAFTLIEVLIVVIILGILASVVLVNVSGASREARESVLRDELRFVRTQLTLYRASHENAPGMDNTGTVNAAALMDQMTLATDYQGNIGGMRPDAQHTLGPYLAQFPVNPINGKDTIRIVAGDSPLTGAIDDSANFGWIYKPETLEFCANSTEYGPSGRNW